MHTRAVYTDAYTGSIHGQHTRAAYTGSIHGQHTRMHTRAAYTDAYTGSREDDSKNSSDKYTKSSSPRLYP